MAKLSALLSKRMKGSSKDETKMDKLAKRSSSGDLSTFSGMFGMSTLSPSEKEELKSILAEHCKAGNSIDGDLETLTILTSEVKAIANQAILLHGERIQKAQKILGDYHDGAFSSWLTATYGNRQTPYNFLQYFEFYTKLGKDHRLQVEEMPRQVVYTLASREGDEEKKIEIIEKYHNETKEELLSKIRESFPLPKTDKRSGTSSEKLLKSLQSLLKTAARPSFTPSIEQKSQIETLLEEIRVELAKR